MRKGVLIIVVLLVAVMVLSACGKPGVATSTPDTSSSPQQQAPGPTQAVQTQSTISTDSQAPAPTDPPVAVLDGKTLLEERCGSCHAIEKATSHKASYDEWTKVVDTMIKRGAKLSEEERAVLVQYLADNFK